MWYRGKVIVTWVAGDVERAVLGADELAAGPSCFAMGWCVRGMPCTRQRITPRGLTKTAVKEDGNGGPELLAGTAAELAKPRVGVAGFEPTTSSSRTKRATKLRYTPMTAREV
jgi:hypothetical protein